VRTHRDLTPYPLADALKKQPRVMTMGEGQWNAMLAAAYEQGWILLELNDEEKPVRAYRRANPDARRTAG
jgi:hypothetical protein